NNNNNSSSSSNISINSNNSINSNYNAIYRTTSCRPCPAAARGLGTRYPQTAQTADCARDYDDNTLVTHGTDLELVL
ncbi:MAG TPA: hypothetical protein V6C97_05945, partial [Oculatellaceae cyanobacterium]